MGNPQQPGKKKAQRGFTLTELIMVIVIMGILAAVAAPRFFDKNAFDSRGYYDQVMSTLRFAQKTAVAQRRPVCVAFTAGSIELTIDSSIPPDGGCDAALTSPEGLAPYIVTAPSGVTLSDFVTPFSFTALGRATVAQSITVSGYATPITVEAETGYVH
ncbi:MAG: GspH/FimT family pseudopilin [Sideroxyarcus sp.]|nr:GspH/FimT family pseudopilin [Sideroxyarcus sp.]